MDGSKSRQSLISYPIRTWIEDYLLALEAENVSPHILRTYRRSLAEYAAWCEARGQRDVRELDGHGLRTYIREMRRGEHRADGKPLAAKSISLYQGVIRSWGTWLVREEILPEHPFERVKSPKLERSQPVPLTTEECQALLDVCRRDRTYLGARDAAIILVLLDTGLRVSELRSLTIEAALSGGPIQVMGKGRKQRAVYLRRNARKAILRYLSMREDSEPWLWVGRKGQLRPRAFNQMLFKRCKQAGIRPVHPHLLRHTFAVEALRNGANIVAVQALMGHSTILQTRDYLLLSERDVEEAHRTYSPADRLKW